MTDLVSVNGVITAPEEAKISVYDRGFLFGDAIYEVARTYDRILFGLEPHIERLYKSASSLRIDLVVPQKEMIQQIYNVVNRCTAKEVYMRIQISRGNCKIGPINLNPTNTSKINTVIYVHPMPDYGNAIYQNGIELVTSKITRNPKSALDPNIKSGNYLNNILAFWSSIDNTGYDSILLNEYGVVTEGTTFNVHIVRGGVIYTTPNTSDILQGITRSIIFEVARNQKIQMVEKLFNVNEMYNADEVFMTSSTKEVVPVVKVDDRFINGGKPGPITNLMLDKYREYVTAYTKKMKTIHPVKING